MKYSYVKLALLDYSRHIYRYMSTVLSHTE